VTLTPFILGGLAIFVVGRLFAASGQPDTPPPLPASPPRRPRKRALRTPPALPSVEAEASPATTPAPVPVAPPPRPSARFGAVRTEFATRAALRRAIVAQEVLCPPLSLRPPRQ